jgi:hypothetical protein
LLLSLFPGYFLLFVPYLAFGVSSFNALLLLLDPSLHFYFIVGLSSELVDEIRVLLGRFLFFLLLIVLEKDC